MTRAKPGARPPLVVHPPRFVPMTPEQRARAVAVLKALLISYLREQRAAAGGLDRRQQNERSSRGPIDQ